MPAGQKAADDDLAAVLPVVVSVLSGRFGNSWSSHRVEPCGRLGGIAAGAAGDVSCLSLLPLLPATGGTRTANRRQSHGLTFPQPGGPKRSARFPNHLKPATLGTPAALRTIGTRTAGPAHHAGDRYRADLQFEDLKQVLRGRGPGSRKEPFARETRLPSTGWTQA